MEKRCKVFKVFDFAMADFLKMHLKHSEELFHPEAVNDDVIYNL